MYLLCSSFFIMSLAVFMKGGQLGSVLQLTSEDVRGKGSWREGAPTLPGRAKSPEVQASCIDKIIGWATLAMMHCSPSMKVVVERGFLIQASSQRFCFHSFGVKATELGSAAATILASASALSSSSSSENISSA